jgi:hypothetical protein
MAGSEYAQPPEWARSLDAQGFRTFIALVEDYFASRQIVAHVKPEEGVVQPRSGRLRASVLSLQNIARACAYLAIDQWPRAIAQHFDSIFAMSEDKDALLLDVADFEAVKPQLRARLYPSSLLRESADLIYRPGPEGTIETLVMDLPTTVRTVAPGEAQRWGLRDSDLFEVGRRNLRQSSRLKASTASLLPGTEVVLYHGDPYYAASHALIIQDYLPTDLPYGALVGLPRRDALLLHVIRNVGMAHAVNAMLRVIVGLHREGPGSLSPYLYWLRDDEFLPLPYDLDGKSLDFQPPPEFVALLQHLGQIAELS